MSSVNPSLEQQDPNDMYFRYGDHPERVALIESLRELADYLAAHPHVPTDPCYQDVDVSVHARGGDSERIAFVRQVARELDADPQWEANNTHFRVIKKFGQVRLEYIAILQQARDEYDFVLDVGQAALGRHRAQTEAAAAAAQNPELPAAVVETAAGAPTVELPAAADPDGDGGELAETECADCRGTGRQRDASPCADCLGKGRVLAAAVPALQANGRRW